MEQNDKIKKIQSIYCEPKLKHIAVSQDNYLQLKKYGKFGDTFNDVVTALLQKNKKNDSTNHNLKSDFPQT